MKALRIVLTVLILGVLWGAVELMSLPTFLYISAGILFLAIGRTLINKLGVSIATGAVVCLLKNPLIMQCNFCSWGGILAVAVSFEIFAALFWKEETVTVIKAALVGFGSAALAAPMFIVWVLWLVPEPYWIEGGSAQVVEYFMTTGLYAALLSLIAAPAAHLLGSFFKKWYPAESKAVTL